MYALGLTGAALGLFGTIALFTQFLLSRVERELQSSAKASLLVGAVVVLALGIHAWVPTQQEVFELLVSEEDITNNSKLGFQSTVHDLAANVFFLASCLYITLVSPCRACVRRQCALSRPSAARLGRGVW